MITGTDIFCENLTRYLFNMRTMYIFLRLSQELMLVRCFYKGVK